MVFSSLTFIFGFLPLVLFFYFISSNKTYKTWVLIVFSLFFYAWGEPVWVTLLVFSTTASYLLSLIIEKNRGKWLSKAAFISSVVVNLSLLAYFKYIGFVIDNVNSIFGLNITYREYALPIGISFYTFQTLSYVIDVYKGQVKAQKNYSKLLLYVSLFPQLIAGPIVRYRDIEQQIENREITPSKFSEGINRFVIGLGKKVIIANPAGELSTFFLRGNISELSILGAWFGISLFALQIYFDFSGYSDMAIGLGRMFGFDFKENFNYPYISRSATEFWRRWHISLGSFFRDYVYIPLGGNRRCYIRNIFVVWFLTGLWHGASWNFVIWGVYYGLLIYVERQFLIKLFDRIPAIFSHIYLMAAVLVGWVFFYFTDLNAGLNYLKVMWGINGNQLTSPDLFIHLNNNIFYYISAITLSTPLVKNIALRLNKKVIEKTERNVVIQDLLITTFNFVLLALAVTFLVGETYNPFLYFRF